MAWTRSWSANPPIAIAAALLMAGGNHAAAQGDARPFTGDISTFKTFTIGQGSSGIRIGDWVYAISGVAPILTNKRVRHSEFSPLAGC
jgi:hypothetical protein